MNWEQLLSLKRHGDTTKRLRIEQDETRLGFEVDYDRIIFSASFRSLQDKTQVIPLSNTDFVHTRLTHSLEVSVVGRSLGRLAGKQLLEKHPYLKESLGYQFNDFGAIVAAASLAHDIGNPPFGHSGEKAIGAYFHTGAGKRFQTQLTKKEYQDLIDFEGNANGFHLLCKSMAGKTGGLRLSYATLGAFLKYPKESLPKKPTKHIADKKYGFFQADKAMAKEVATNLGLIARNANKEDIQYHRHPLVYLVEAADDICYTIIDFEDGINLGLIPEERALEFLLKLVKDKINTKKYNLLEYTEDRVSYLRALAISTLIEEAVHIFIENETAILEGNFHAALLDKCKYKAQIEEIIKQSVEQIYQSEEVTEKEIAGYAILSDLLHAYTTAAYGVYTNTATNYHKLLVRTMPVWVIDSAQSVYDLLLHVSSYIASLSDSRAVQLHQKIQGKVI